MARTSTLEIARRIKVPKRGAGAAATIESKSVRRARDTGSAAAAALVDPNKPATANQLAFAKAWAQGESISGAALRAGYADDGIGYRLARMPNILKIYHREKALYEASCQMTRQKVMDMLLESYQMAKLMSEPASMVSAAREVGKMCGYYEPIKHVLDVNVKGEVTVRQLNSMSDAELLKIMTNDAPFTPPQLPAPNVEEVEDIDS